MQKSFWIPTCYIEKLEKKLSSLQRKAKKLNCPDISFRRTGNEKFILHRDPENYAKEIRLKYFEYEVEGKAPFLEGWNFVARIDHGAGNNILMILDETISIPEKYWHIEKWCDHCNTKRVRKDTFLVWNEKEGFKQVGRQCLKDYLGHISPERIGEALSYINLFAKLSFSDPEENDEIPLEYGELKPEPYLDLKNGILYSLFVLEAEGKYIPVREADGILTVSTKEKIEYYLFDKKAPKIEFTDAQKGKTESIINSFRETKETGSFWLNVKSIFSDDYFEARHLGIACAAIHIYLKREMERKTQRESHFIGKEKERKELELTLIKTISYESMYGMGNIFIFTDNEGNICKWFTSTDPKWEKDETKKVKATIKKHELYQGKRETIINRVK